MSRSEHVFLSKCAPPTLFPSKLFLSHVYYLIYSANPANLASTTLTNTFTPLVEVTVISYLDYDKSPASTLT